MFRLLHGGQCDVDLANVLLPLQTSIGYPSSPNAVAPRYSPWDDTSMLIIPSDGIISAQDEYYLHGCVGMHASDIGSKEVERINNISSSDIWSSIRDMPSSEPANQGEEGFILHERFCESLLWTQLKTRQSSFMANCTSTATDSLNDETQLNSLAKSQGASEADPLGYCLLEWKISDTVHFI